MAGESLHKFIRTKIWKRSVLVSYLVSTFVSMLSCRVNLSVINFAVMMSHLVIKICRGDILPRDHTL